MSSSSSMYLSIFSSAFFEHYAHAQQQPVSARGDADGPGLAYLRAFDHAVNAVTLKTRPGRTEGGMAIEVPKYELRDPALPSRQAYRPKPWAAGLPVLLHAGGEERRGEERVALERLKSL